MTEENKFRKEVGMRKSKQQELKIILYPVFVTLLFTLLLLTAIMGCVSNVANPSNNEPNKICGASNETLSPDGKNIIFAKRNWLNDTIILATYEVSTGIIHKIKPTDNDYHTDPVYSPDGKKIAFIAGKKLNSGNVFIMNCDGSNVRQLTFNDDRYPENGGKYHTNETPTFSPDGRKIIFVRSGIVLTRPTDMKANWNIYEVDILSGSERRLTSYRLFLISRPYFMPDGRRFIFSGDTFAKEYKHEYSENQIYLMDETNTELKPAFVYGDRSFVPTVAENGDIVFLARTNHIDGFKGPSMYDLFLMRKGEITRITKMRFSEPVLRPFISHDGSRIIFRACTRNNLGSQLWIMNGDGTGLTELKIDYSEFD
jgi:Tol biopolymer transport system component